MSVSTPTAADEKIQELVDATTELTQSVNVSKATLDNAVSESSSSATVATKASKESVSAKGETITARNEAVKAKEDAVAVVTGGTAVLESEAGKIPIADSKGHIASGWTPLLTAMYPYSGVIGSVDKKAFLEFYTGYHESTVTANRIQFKSSPQFSIGGRFVKVQSWMTIVLPEAESTADRAIAFDDIFLDWNGNVQTYRSITPHRTVTGYDRDAIATEHGYSKVQTGLYKIGDTYALLLGRVARRNQGGYHPVLNPEGSRKFNRVGSWSNLAWYHTDSFQPTSKEDCFIILDGNPSNGNDRGAFIDSGKIGTLIDNRADKKYYDAIYSDDFTPLYYSAKNVIDRQALLFDSFNRAVAGETFSGAEGTVLGVVTECTSGLVDSRAVNFDKVNAPAFAAGANYTPDTLIVFNYTQNKLVSVEQRFWTNLNSQLQIFKNIGSEPDIVIGDKCLIILYARKHFPIQQITTHTSARPQFLMVDIIGSLDAMPDEWKTNGIPGNWLAVGEEGESLIPDGTSKNYKMSHKCLEAYQVLKTADKGVTWSDVTSTYKAAIEGATNSMGSQSVGATEVYMVFYRTSANPFELADKNSFIARNDGRYVCDSQEWRGCLTVERMIGKVATSSQTSGFFAVTDHGSYLTRWNTPVQTTPVDLTITVSPAVKVLPSLSNGGFLYFAYQELKNNGTSWGDDGKFTIVDKQSTMTDLNGDNAIVGTKRVSIPFQFNDGDKY